jgi:LPS-assembly lipoprotein
MENAMSQSIRRIQLLTALLVLALIQGCGWRLAGSADLPSQMSPVFISGLQTYEPLSMALKRALRSNDIEIAESKSEAATILSIYKRETNTRTLSVTADTGKVAEYELFDRIFFNLTDTQGKVLMPEQTTSAQEDYLNQEDEVLGKRREQETIRKEMHQKIVRQILWSLDRHLGQ